MKPYESFSFTPAALATCACNCVHRLSRYIPVERHHDFLQIQQSIRRFNQLNYADRETLMLVCGQLLDLLPLGCRPRIEMCAHHKDVLSAPEINRNGFTISLIIRSDIRLTNDQQKKITCLSDAFAQHGPFFSLHEFVDLMNDL